MNIGRITFGPNAGKPFTLPPPPVRPERGLGGVDCVRCDQMVLCLIGGPPKEWKWTSDGWLCPDCCDLGAS